MQQTVGEFAEAVAAAENAAAIAFAMRDPLTATGAALSAIVQLNAILRKAGARTIIPVTITGTPGTVVSAGAQISNADSTQLYAIDADRIIPASGTIDAMAAATAYGPFDPDPGTVVVIQTPISGWSAVTNGATTSVGTMEETDEELRRRQQQSTNATSYRQIEAIRAAILNIPGVTFCRAYQNSTLLTDDRGIPGKTLAAVVEGGDSREIARAILYRVPLVIGYYGNTAETFYDELNMATVVWFSRPVERPVWNQILYLVSGIARDSETYGIPIWSPLTNYAGKASLCIGTDGTPYRATKNSGPGVAAGPKDPTTTTGYWQTLAEYVISDIGGGGGNPFANDLVYPGAIGTFFLSSPPANWRVRNGQLITSASTVCPQLYAALQTSKFASLLASEATWQSMSGAAGGIGGVPRFVLNTGAKTIRLPDTRGDYMEHAGFNGLAVGGWHSDAIRNFTGEFPTAAYSWTGYSKPPSGVFKWTTQTNADGDNPGRYGMNVAIDITAQVPTSVANMPRAFGVLGCVYVGPPAA